MQCLEISRMQNLEIYRHCIKKVDTKSRWNELKSLLIGSKLLLLSIFCQCLLINYPGFDEMDHEFEGSHITKCPDWNLIHTFLQYVLPKPLDEIKLTFGNKNRKMK